MLFSYLINTVFNLHGPVTDYWSYHINSHISYEYVITEGERCNIGIGVTLDNDDTSLSWERFPVKDDVGQDVTVITDPQQKYWTEGYSERSLMFQPEDSPSNGNLRAVLLMEPKNPRFGFTINLTIKDRSGNLSTETTTVRCDVSQCNCKEDR